jgi:hypothetical protein
MKRKACFLLLHGLLLLLIGQKVQAQISLSDFKVDGGTSINSYPYQSTPRIATFSLKLTKSLTTSDNYVPTIKLIKRDGNFVQEGVVTGLTVGQINYVYTPQSNNNIATVTGTFRIDYNDVGAFGTTVLRAELTCCSTSPPRSSEVTVNRKTTLSDAVTITSFTIDGAKALSINSVAKTVTYSLGLSKDPGYTDEFSIAIISNSGAVTFGASEIISAGATTNSSTWPLTGTKRVGTITKPFQISSQNVSTADNNLAAVAKSFRGEILKVTPRLSSTETTAIALTVTAPPCVSDVYVQNTSSLKGTTSAGKNLYAGRAVANTTNGDVVIRSGQNVGFTAREGILMSDGFTVEAGATFAAYIDGGVCSSARLASEEAVAYKPTSEQTSSRSFTGQEQQIATAYPNPTAATLILPEGVENVTLLDQQGRPMQVRSKSGKMNVQNLPDGMYNLQMQQNGKVVNQHIEIKH